MLNKLNMKIAICCKTPLYNSIIYQHYFAVEQLSPKVSYYNNIMEISLEKKYDYIIFHWPEASLSWKKITLDDTKKFSVKLSNLKKFSHIVSYVHNIIPHIKDSNKISIYKALYSLSDSFLHFSLDSRKKLEDEYPAVQNKSHFYIPHGLYRQNLSSFTPSKNKKIIITSLGAIRKKSELDNIVELAKEIRLQKLEAEIKIPMFFKEFTRWKKIDSLKFLIPFCIFLIKHKILPPLKFNFTDIEIEKEVNQSDIILLPRRDGLNSGLLYLAATSNRPIMTTNMKLCYPQELQTYIHRSKDAKLLIKNLKVFLKRFKETPSDSLFPQSYYYLARQYREIFKHLENVS